MSLKTQTLLKAFLSMSKYQEELLKFLPAQLAEQVQNTPLGHAFTPSTFFSSSTWSTSIHYSWFSAFIKDFPPKARHLFLDILTPAQASGLQQMLSISGKTHSSSFLRPFLSDILRKNLLDPDILDTQLLPPSVMNVLLDLERKYLLYTADLLGLYDLAADLRQVVDKEILRKIYNALTAEQLHFLSYCSKQTLKWVPPKLGLNGWDGSKQQLKSLIHYRGLMRLAKAIYRENTSYKWHLLHKIDTGRAKIIQKELYQKQDPNLISFFKNQVLHIAKRYAS